jgi:hypothetical protein
MLNKFSAHWHKFWFEEQSVLPLALFRIVLGLFVLQVSLGELLPNFSLLFGVKGMFDTSSIAVHWWHKVPIFNIFLLLPQDDFYRFCFFCAFVIFAFFLTIGFCTRISAIFVYLGLLTFDTQCPLVLDAGDDFMRLATFLMIFGPAGEAISVDRILKAKKQKIDLQAMPPLMVSPWIQRMLQIQISLVYICALLPKFFGDQWLGGFAVYYASQLTDFAKFPLPDVLRSYPLCKIPTYYTLLVEFSMATFVWIKPLRYWILLAAVLMHLGIDWTMNLPGFEWLFIGSYVLFIDPQDLKKLALWLRSLINFKTRFSYAITNKKLHQKNLTYNYSFLPIFILLISILMAGSFLGTAQRAKYVQVENQSDYSQRLNQISHYWQNKLDQYSSLPENDQSKLTAEEALGTILSLSKNYAEASKLLRIAIAQNAKQESDYNPKLISSFSSLANIYLETGHLDAAELCYKTILNYDAEHYGHAPNRQCIELNNLGVLTYLRGLIAQNKNQQYIYFDKASDLYEQALNKSHNFENRSSPGFRETEASILFNQYLSLRDFGHFKAAKNAKAQAFKRLATNKKLALP